MTEKPLIFVPLLHEDDPLFGLKDSDLLRLRQYFEITSAKQLKRDQSQASQIKGVLWYPKITKWLEEFLPKLTSLKVITSLSTGMDRFPFHLFQGTEVKIGYIPANRQQNKTIADYALLLLLSVNRNFKDELGYMEGKVTASMNRVSNDVTNKTLGIIGLGRIGFALAKRAHAFEMKILYNNRSPRSDIDIAEYHHTLETMLPQCDFLAICCPRNEQSYKMIGRKQFELMKSSAIVINVSRGAVIDTDALVEALQTGQIHGAGLDVTDPEPLPKDHPLFTLPNVVVTSHCSWNTHEAADERWEMAIDNLKAGLEGKALPYACPGDLSHL